MFLGLFLFFKKVSIDDKNEGASPVLANKREDFWSKVGRVARLAEM